MSLGPVSESLVLYVFRDCWFAGAGVHFLSFSIALANFPSRTLVCQLAVFQGWELQEHKIEFDRLGEIVTLPARVLTLRLEVVVFLRVPRSLIGLHSICSRR